MRAHLPHSLLSTAVRSCRTHLAPAPRGLHFRRKHSQIYLASRWDLVHLLKEVDLSQSLRKYDLREGIRKGSRPETIEMREGRGCNFISFFEGPKALLMTPP